MKILLLCLVFLGGCGGGLTAKQCKDACAEAGLYVGIWRPGGGWVNNTCLCGSR
jgi:hypothetical protein